jgi:alcohol dehydrogenase
MERDAMTSRALYFTGDHSVEVRESAVPEPGAGEVLVRTERSGISSGTELLVYRGDVSRGTKRDQTIDALDGTFSYPLQYGYSAVGRVSQVGADVDDSWRGQRVFAFHPHASHFIAEPDSLIPTTLSPERGVFIPNVEAAVNFVMDARPRLGARVVVFGQGVVGLLTTAVLAQFPLDSLVTVDYDETRRALSEEFGADRAVSPDAIPDTLSRPADITLELSGNPEALDDAVDVTGYAGRVLVGSWYGTKDVHLQLAEGYHRSHIRIRSSQVSRIDPDHADRWDKERRMSVVTDWLAETDLSKLLTHEFAIENAVDAYRLLDDQRDDVMQVSLTYD